MEIPGAIPCGQVRLGTGVGLGFREGVSGAIARAASVCVAGVSVGDGGMAFAVEIGHVVGALSLNRREVFRGDQTPAEEQLLILSVEHDQSHDQILILPQKIPDLRASRAGLGAERKPMTAVLPDSPERLVQPGQQFAAGFQRCRRGRGVGLSQMLGFPLQMPQEVGVEGQLGAEVCRHLNLGSHWNPAFMAARACRRGCRWSTWW